MMPILNITQALKGFFTTRSLNNRVRDFNLRGSTYMYLVTQLHLLKPATQVVLNITSKVILPSSYTYRYSKMGYLYLPISNTISIHKYPVWKFAVHVFPLHNGLCEWNQRGKDNERRDLSKNIPAYDPSHSLVMNSERESTRFWPGT